MSEWSADGLTRKFDADRRSKRKHGFKPTYDQLRGFTASVRLLVVIAIIGL